MKLIICRFNFIHYSRHDQYCNNNYQINNYLELGSIWEQIDNTYNPHYDQYDRKQVFDYKGPYFSHFESWMFIQCRQEAVHSIEPSEYDTLDSNKEQDTEFVHKSINDTDQITADTCC